MVGLFWVDFFVCLFSLMRKLQAFHWLKKSSSFMGFLMNFHTISGHRSVLERLYLLRRHELEDLMGLSQIETKLVHSKMTSN